MKNNYSIRLNLKSIILFEKMRNKSFFKMDEEDYIYLLYAMLFINNADFKFEYKVFKSVMESDKKFALSMINLYKKETYNKIFDNDEDGESNGEKQSGDTPEFRMGNVASSLIIKYGMDPHYVMYEMDVWEINDLLLEAEKHTESEMEEQRLWTYMTMLPHIDGSKIGGPSKLLPFPWEKDSAVAEIEANRERISEQLNRTFNFNFNNGKSDTDAGSGGLQEDSSETC